MSYIKKSVRPVRVLQFGEGNFIRGFVDWMFDIANEKGLTDTSVAVVSPRFKENSTIKNMQSQDCIYHVWLEGIEKGRPKSEKRLVKCVTDAFSPAVDFKRYERYILSPELRFVVSNTTEAGIRYEDDDILSETPVTFPGKITSLLYRRFRHFNGDKTKGLIFLCCELIENNGSALREYVLRHAAATHLEPEFSEWIKDSCIFCNTLVDRIVSGFPHDTIDEVRDELGFDDRLVVKGELFHIWAIGCEKYAEVQKELPLDKAGLNVLFMPDIKSFREKKVRILNGSHTGMAPIALLSGCDTVLDAFETPDINRFINDMTEREVLSVMDGDISELRSFSRDILERFHNPFMRHMLKSIALNSLSKWETRNFPTVRDFYNKKGLIADFEIFTFAALMALYSPYSGFIAEDDAANIDVIQGIWADGGDYIDIVRKITGSGIFTDNFEEAVPGFSQRAGEYLRSIMTDGMDRSLTLFLNTRCNEKNIENT
ncbi:MAG TPA: tagaturonate reductase [Muribaculum sp.]|jgi:tagaturonate reductase|uniref:Tagaturonate reductase n=1 Tax=Heminiphilus faecis TaxID=2601703 RepID=A0ABV4CYQ7_9BACT|nr:tagaturonate reductase [Heminiphilus faecis]DAT44870.1 MAG TPA: altronate oxidoreductase [Caudoviricetes sp.]HRF68862.1 tagaturonate reductase [Muribaculum sp.]